MEKVITSTNQKLVASSKLTIDVEADSSKEWQGFIDIAIVIAISKVSRPKFLIYMVRYVKVIIVRVLRLLTLRKARWKNSY